MLYTIVVNEKPARRKLDLKILHVIDVICPYIIFMMYSNELEKDNLADNLLKWLMSTTINAGHLHELS
jgi:hypothetical protein